MISLAYGCAIGRAAAEHVEKFAGRERAREAEIGELDMT